VSAMTQRLAHRGPDDGGVVELGPLVLGHRRLSVLDVSDRGHQPMSSADGRLILAHNGEVYNFVELAEELRRHGHRFRTSTDTEVMLAAFQEWGDEAVDRFEGIWAFALWDTAEQRLTLSRDRFGVKPLFLAEGNGIVAFASEIKALLEIPWVSREPNPRAIRTYLADGLVDHTDETFFRSIRRLPAAHTLSLQRGDRRLRRYWGPPALNEDSHARRDPGDRRRVEEIRDLFIRSVARQLRTDVSIGSCLSGGLDSSAIVSTASAIRGGRFGSAGLPRRDREGLPQLAFFAEFRGTGIDERRFVDAVVRETGTTLRTTSPDATAFLETLGPIVQLQDEPFVSTSIVAQYHVMQEAHKAGITVLLDGQGADELFAGYPPYIGARLGGALRALDPDSLRLVAKQLRRTPRLSARAMRFALFGLSPRPRWWPTPPGNLLLGRAAKAAEPLELESAPTRGSVLTQLLWRHLTSESLPALLRYEDRNSMAFAIEARVPFLDRNLVEAALLLPDRLRLDGTDRKIALRRAMAGIVPDVVLARRDKIAFAPPEAQWLSAAMPLIRDLAVEPAAEARDFVRRGTLRTLADRWPSASVPKDVLWRVVNLELWLRMCVEAQRDAVPAATARPGA
jgi:asparagine synthase (glutamine-hydrolysing)